MITFWLFSFLLFLSSSLLTFSIHCLLYSYVGFIWSQDTKKGSKMDGLKQYIQQRDKQKTGAGEKKRASASLPAAPKAKCTAFPPPSQSSPSQPATTHGELYNLFLVHACTCMFCCNFNYNNISKYRHFLPSDSTEPTDEDLLASAIEIEPQGECCLFCV